MKVTLKSPKKRNTSIIMKSAYICCAISTIILWYYGHLSGRFLSSNLIQVWFSFGLKRIYRFISDVNYWKNVKQYSCKDLIMRSIQLNQENMVYVMLSLTLIVTSLYDSNNSLITTDCNMLCRIAELIFSPALIALLSLRGMDEYPTQKSIYIEESRSSLACGFYYGYLRIILPTLPEKINTFMDKQQVDIPVKKLLVLIPSSVVLFDEVKTLSTEQIEVSQNLDDLNHTRTFVVDRTYKNSVYKIRDSETNKLYYVVCEGATPLKTFYEQCKEDQTMFDYKRETVYAFYNTLKELLDKDPEIRDSVELLYYEDYEKPGYGSKTTKLPDIIIARLKEIIFEQNMEKLRCPQM